MNHGAVMAASSMLVLMFPTVFTPHSQSMFWRGEIKTLLFAFLCHVLSSQPWRLKMKWLHLHLFPLPSHLDVAPSGLWRICTEKDAMWESVSSSGLEPDMRCDT